MKGRQNKHKQGFIQSSRLRPAGLPTPTVTLVWNPDGLAQFCGKITEQGKSFPYLFQVPRETHLHLNNSCPSGLNNPQNHLKGHPKGSVREHKMVWQNWMMSQGEENDQNPRTWNFTETDSGSALHGLLNPESPVTSLLTGRQCPVVPQQDHTHWPTVQLQRQIA